MGIENLEHLKILFANIMHVSRIAQHVRKGEGRNQGKDGYNEIHSRLREPKL